MTENEILSLKKKVNKVRLEINTLLEDLQNYTSHIIPEKDITEEEPF